MAFPPSAKPDLHMNPSSIPWKVGLFVLLCLVLLGGLILNFSKGLAMFQPTYTLRLKTTNMGSLKKDASVQMAGVRVGYVADTQLATDGRDVTLLLKIYERYTIHRDAEFTIDTVGFLGDQFVSITPTKNAAPVLTNLSEVVCREPFNLQEVARSAVGFIQRIDETARSLNASLARVDEHVLDEETLTNLSTAIANLHLASERFAATVDRADRLIELNARPVSVTITNLAAFSRELNELAENLRRVVTANEAGLSAAVKNIESSSGMIKSLLLELQAGSGLAGSLLKNEELGTNFTQLVGNLTLLSSNLNRHGFLWKPRRLETRPPSPLYPGRDPRR